MTHSHLDMYGTVKSSHPSNSDSMLFSKLMKIFGILSILCFFNFTFLVMEANTVEERELPEFSYSLHKTVHEELSPVVQNNHSFLPLKVEKTQKINFAFGVDEVRPRHRIPLPSLSHRGPPLAEALFHL